MSTLKALGATLFIVFTLAGLADAQITLRGLGGRGRQETEKTKNIHGVVRDSAGRPIAGARVQVRSVKDNTTRLATTDAQGSYSLQSLPPDSDYEVRADYKGQVSDPTVVSALLDREDNLVSFQLNIVADTSTPAAAAADSGPELQTFDLVKLRATFELPRSVPAPIPAVLLLHGYGEDRHVWEGFRRLLLANGYAVMALDLRGHGDSKTRNQRPFTASAEWRTSPHEFPHDIDPALDWLKTQPRLDSRKIVIIGYDLGANLALISSGKFKEVRTVVAVKPNLQESLAMAGSAQDFQPRSVLVIGSDEAEGSQIKAYVQDPFRLLTAPVSGGSAQWLSDKQVTDAVMQWLKETF